MDNMDMLRQPDYMDRFTGLVSDRYSDYRLLVDLSFEDSDGNLYTGREFKVPAATLGTFKIVIRNEGKALPEGS